MAKYTYSIASDITAQKADGAKLKSDYESSSITVALDYIHIKNDALYIYTKADLSTGQESDLDDLVEAHDGIVIAEPEIEVDEEGRQINRNAFGKKGWTYLSHPIEFQTSKKDSVFSEDYLGNDRADYVLKFYDADGDEITSGLQADLDTDCVETRLTMKLNYDYEIISGTIDIHSDVTDDIRLWVVGGVMDQNNMPWEYPTGIYQVKEFAGGVNFKYIGVDQKLETDGRAAKFMSKNKTGVPFQTNQFQFIMKHPAGKKHDFMITLEYFRA